MPINVTGPDGVSIDFPDGMDSAAIADVMRRHYGGGDAAAAPKASPITAGHLAEAALDVPVLGPAARKVDAAVRAAVAPYGGNKYLETKLPEQSFGERYSHALKTLEDPLQKFETEHPVASGLANVAGTVGTALALPVGAPVMGARILGLTGGGLGRQMLAGAASGAGINAVDAAMRGNDPAMAGLVGGGLGAAGPLAGRAIGTVAAPVANTIRGIVNPTEEGARRVGAALGQDISAGSRGLTPQQFATAQAAGAPVMAMDVGDEMTRALARSAANTSPEARAILNKAIDERFVGQSQRMVDDLNSQFHYPNVEAQQAAIDTAERIANKAAYGKAFKEGAGGIWSPELEALAGSDAVSDAMKKAASVAKDEATLGGYGAMNPRITFTPDGRMQFTRGPGGVPTYPDLQYWDLVRRQLSNGAKVAQRAGNMEDARRLGGFAARLNAELDKSVPSYQEARQGAAGFFGAENALEAGQKFATTGRFDNQGARAALDKMTDSQKKLFQDGFVDALMQRIRSSPDRSNIAGKIANSPAAREQMNIAMGPQQASEFMGRLHVENIMDAARNAIQGNSTTTRQLRELLMAGGVGGGASLVTGDPQSILHGALVYGALKHGGGAVMANVNEKVAREVARLLTSQNLGQVRLGMNLLGRNQGLLGNLRRADAALARAGAAQLQPDQRNQ